MSVTGLTSVIASGISARLTPTAKKDDLGREDELHIKIKTPADRDNDLKERLEESENPHAVVAQKYLDLLQEPADEIPEEDDSLFGGIGPQNLFDFLNLRDGIAKLQTDNMQYPSLGDVSSLHLREADSDEPKLNDQIYAAWRRLEDGNQMLAVRSTSMFSASA